MKAYTKLNDYFNDTISKLFVEDASSSAMPKNSRRSISFASDDFTRKIKSLLLTNDNNIYKTRSVKSFIYQIFSVYAIQVPVETSDEFKSLLRSKIRAAAHEQHKRLGKAVDLTPEQIRDVTKKAKEDAERIYDFYETYFNTDENGGYTKFDKQEFLNDMLTPSGDIDCGKLYNGFVNAGVPYHVLEKCAAFIYYMMNDPNSKRTGNSFVGETMNDYIPHSGFSDEYVKRLVDASSGGAPIPFGRLLTKQNTDGSTISVADVVEDIYENQLKTNPFKVIVNTNSWVKHKITSFLQLYRIATLSSATSPNDVYAKLAFIKNYIDENKLHSTSHDDAPPTGSKADYERIMGQYGSNVSSKLDSSTRKAIDTFSDLSKRISDIFDNNPLLTDAVTKAQMLYSADDQDMGSYRFLSKDIDKMMSVSFSGNISDAINAEKNKCVFDMLNTFQSPIGISENLFSNYMFARKSVDVDSETDASRLNMYFKKLFERALGESTKEKTIDFNFSDRQIEQFLSTVKIKKTENETPDDDRIGSFLNDAAFSNFKLVLNPSKTLLYDTSRNEHCTVTTYNINGVTRKVVKYECPISNYNFFRLLQQTTAVTRENYFTTKEPEERRRLTDEARHFIDGGMSLEQAVGTVITKNIVEKIRKGYDESDKQTIGNGKEMPSSILDDLAKIENEFPKTFDDMFCFMKHYPVHKNVVTSLGSTDRDDGGNPITTKTRELKLKPVQNPDNELIRQIVELIHDDYFFFIAYRMLSFLFLNSKATNENVVTKDTRDSDLIAEDLFDNIKNIVTSNFADAYNKNRTEAFTAWKNVGHIDVSNTKFNRFVNTMAVNTLSKTVGYQNGKPSLDKMNARISSSPYMSRMASRIKYAISQSTHIAEATSDNAAAITRGIIGKLQDDTTDDLSSVDINSLLNINKIRNSLLDFYKDNEKSFDAKSTNDEDISDRVIVRNVILYLYEILLFVFNILSLILNKTPSNSEYITASSRSKYQQTTNPDENDEESPSRELGGFGDGMSPDEYNTLSKAETTASDEETTASDEETTPEDEDRDSVSNTFDDFML